MAYDALPRTIGRVDFLGVPFTPLDRAAAAECIAERARSEVAFAYVLLANVRHVIGLDREPDRRARFYSHCWLALNNSRVLAGVAKLSGVALPALSGADLAQTLFQRVIDPNDSVAIIGADAEFVAAIAGRHRLNRVQWRPAPKGAQPDAIDKIAAFIARSRARYVFICLDGPEREMIVDAVLRRGDAIGVALCIGDGLQVFGDRMMRKPEWRDRARTFTKRTLSPRRLLDALRIASIWRYWLCARWDRASISARSALWRASSSL
jgi:UDP-N-acetyl-D-mannosaminuronic acid transferase (WecB/TagA/CpsF family)